MSAFSRQKKPKRVRERFTLPESEHAAIKVLKTRAIAMGIRAKKSELLRAGLLLLLDLNEASYKRALAAVPRRRASEVPKALPLRASGTRKAAKPHASASAPPGPRPSRPVTREAATKR